MIEIKVTGNSLAEVSDKLLAIGASLQRATSYDADNAAREALQAKRDAARGATAAEAAHTEEKATVGTEMAKRTRKPKTPNAETQAAIAEVAAGETTKLGTVEEALEELNEPKAEDVNFDIDVAPLVLDLVKRKGPEAIRGILDQFGVVRASQVDPARFPELLDLLNEALA